MPQLPKFRNGYTSDGAHVARMMGGPTPALTRRRGDALVRRVGDFIDVIRMGGPLQAFALGNIGDVATIVASDTGRGRFLHRGPAPEDGGFVTSELAYFGRQYGIAARSKAAGTHIFESPAFGSYTVTETAIERTRDGRRFSDYYTYVQASPAGYLSASTQVPGGYRPTAAGPAFYAGAAWTAIGEDEPLPVYLHDDGRGTFTTGAALYAPSHRPHGHDLMTLAPGQLLRVDRYLRALDSADEACPGLVFTSSRDGGLTWQQVEHNDFCVGELAALRALTVSAGFDIGAAYASFWAAPISGTKAVMVGVVPYAIGTTAEAYEVRWKLKVGSIDLSDGIRIGESVELADGPVRSATVWRESLSMVAMKGAALVSYSPVTGELDEWIRPQKVYTSDGAGLTFVAELPQPTYRTGVITGWDRDTLICPFYDGEHSLYASDDLGETWRRWATIAKGGPVPNPAIEQYVLGDFSRITVLQRDGRPAPAFPMTPWVTDCRIEAPQ